MNKIDFVNNLASSFGEEIIVVKNGKHFRNIKIQNVFNYIDKIFDEDDSKIIYDFYKYILENFEVKGFERYPSVARIKKLYYSFLESKLIEETKYIPFSERDMDRAFGNVHNISYEPPSGVDDIPMAEKLRDYEKLSDDDMLKKYGIRLTAEVWRYVWDAEDKNKIKNPDYFHD